MDCGRREGCLTSWNQGWPRSELDLTWIWQSDLAWKQNHGCAHIRLVVQIWNWTDHTIWRCILLLCPAVKACIDTSLKVINNEIAKHNLRQRTVIAQAVDEFNRLTCITIVPREARDMAFVFLRRSGAAGWVESDGWRSKCKYRFPFLGYVISQLENISCSSHGLFRIPSHGVGLDKRVGHYWNVFKVLSAESILYFPMNSFGRWK